MKTSIILLLFSLTSFVMNANGNPGNTPDNAKLLTIETHTWKSEFVKVQIRNANGETLLSETVKTGNLRRYNLKNLPAGEYTMEMSDTYRITEQPFSITNQQVLVDSESTIIYKPVVQVRPENVDINLMTLGQPAFITIFDQTGNVYFEEKCKESAVHRRYDISRLPAGDYQVNVQVGDRFFTETIRK